MEEDDMNFNHLSLEDLSVIAVASQLWQNPDLNKHLYDSFSKWRRWDARQPDNLSVEISTIISEMLNRFEFPRILKKKIHEEALEIGERISNWKLYLIEDLHLDRNYSEKIFLRYDGEIDEDAIFKSVWTKLSGYKPSKKFDEKITLLYYLACFFGQEEFIVNSETDIINVLRSIFPSNTYDVSSIMKTIICYYDKMNILNSVNCSERLKMNLMWVSDFQLLDICKSYGFYKPFIYFWKNVNEREKFNYLEKSSKMGEKVRYETKNISPITLFLLGEMNSTQKGDFISKNFYDLFSTFVKKRSYDKFCVRLVKKYSSQLPKYEMERLFGDFVCYYLDSKKDSHIEIFKILMEKVDKNVKRKILIGSPDRVNFCWSRPDSENPLIHMFETFDIPILKLIINDQDLKSNRTAILSKGRNKFMKLMQSNDLEPLDEFSQEIFESEEERIDFKKNCNYLKDWIQTGQMTVVSSVLNWLRGLSNKDKLNIINYQLHYHTRSLLPKHQDFIVQLLKWYIDAQTAPLIDHCKDRSLLKEFSRQLIFKIWFGSNFAFNRFPLIISARILTCVFGTEEEIANFKKTDLGSNPTDTVKFFCERILENDKPGKSERSFSVMEDFFKFCLFDPEKINDVKKIIADDVDDWVVKYGVSVRIFNVVVPLLNWIYGNETDTREKLKSYFEDESEIELYYKNRNRD